MLFAVTYWSGLKPVVLEDARERMGRIDVVRTLAGKRHDAIVFECEGRPGNLAKLRSVENAFALCDHFEGVRVSGPKGLRRIREVVKSADFSEATVVVSRARGGTLSEQPRFTVTVNVIGRHNFAPGDVRQLLLDRLRRELGWPHNPDDYEVNVRLQIIRDKGFLGLALAPRQMRKRPYKAATRAGSLAPTVAYCAARLTRPEPGDVFIDPLCGAGTIAIERALAWPAREIVCGDVLAEAVRATRDNAAAAGVHLHAMQWDATRLPLAEGAINRGATNMPYGKDVPLSDPKRFISKVLRELARVTCPDGWLVVVSAHGRRVATCAVRQALFRCEHTMRLPLHGFEASLVVLQRQ